MTRWVDNAIADRLYMVNEVAKSKNINAEAVEKDWWVTMILQTVFELTPAPYMYFKGGTSLSKGWDLIERFSEDVDLAIYRDFFLNELGKSCARCESKTQIRNLKEASRDYIHGEFYSELNDALHAKGLDGVRLEPITTRMTKDGEVAIDHDTDPTVILVHYPTIFNTKEDYIDTAVKIEISCLSMREPFENRHITSLVSEKFPDEDSQLFADINTISPFRTFLEKCLLLCEEYQRAKPRTMRMSRHLYDLEKLMDSDYGIASLKDTVLYRQVVAHREKFYAYRGVDYALDLPENLVICPPEQIIGKFKDDYDNMRRTFIYSKDALSFEELIERLHQLEKYINALQ